MHLLLTDRLTCPRCGPTFGLILLASRLDDRVVLEGRLGCPNCRDGFPIRDGFADLRAPPRDAFDVGLVGEPSAGVGVEAADRLVALLGLVGGPGTVALVGGAARYAPRVAEAAEEVQVAAVDPDLRGWPETARVSRLAAAPGLPFFSSVLRGVALDGRLGDRWLEEGCRVLAPGGRLVVEHARSGTDEALAAAGVSVLASEAETVVAARS